MDDDGRDPRIYRTLPGWAVLAAVLWLLVTRDPPPSDTLVGTLLAAAALFLGVPFVFPKR